MAHFKKKNILFAKFFDFGLIQGRGVLLKGAKK